MYDMGKLFHVDPNQGGLSEPWPPKTAAACTSVVSEQNEGIQEIRSSYITTHDRKR
jgi:hypothetical protein